MFGYLVAGWRGLKWSMWLPYIGAFIARSLDKRDRELAYLEALKRERKQRKDDEFDLWAEDHLDSGRIR